ncbi:unnamed protein product, partial [Mesorhabditis belari]|uniref:Uncharacterized protein n=1 Tax=Mesorhabditis belari TaxID=2138241 RepID=A0AAF3FQ95_9BILA
MMRVFAWIDGRITLRLCLPIDFDKKQKSSLLPHRVDSTNGDNPGIAVARDFASLARARENNGKIHREDWFDIAASLDLPEELTLALFSVAKSSHKEREVQISALTVSLLLLGVEEFYRNLEEYQIETPFTDRNRSTVIFEFIKNNLKEILEVLHISATGNEPFDRIFMPPFSNSLSFLDALFEGLVDMDKSDSDPQLFDIPLPFSKVATQAWKNDRKISYDTLVERLSLCLCVDPFAIDDVTIEKPLCSLVASKKTSLGAGSRRKVFVSDWNRIEVLRRGVYRDAHLRLTNTRARASRIIQPWRSQSVIVDSVTGCSSLVLGPVSGNVLLKNLNNCTIAVACAQLSLQDCHQVEIYCLTLKSPILRSSTNVYIGPYNTYYTGILTEFAEAKLDFAQNEVPKTPILLDNECSFSFISSKDFYVEPLPIEQDEESQEAQTFFSHLPPLFESSWVENFESTQINSMLSVANRLLYCCRCGYLAIPSSSTRSLCTTRPSFRSVLQSTSKVQFTKRKFSTVDTKRASKKLTQTTWKELKAIFSLAAPYKGRILLGLSFLGVSSSVFLLTPRVLGKLIDEHDETKKGNSEGDLTLRFARFFKDNPIALIAALAAGAAAIVARVYCMHTAGQLIINDLRKAVFRSILRQDMTFFDRNRVGEMVSRLSTDALIVGYAVSMNLSDGARALLTCLGSGSLMVYTSPALCKMMVLVIPLVVGIFAVFGRLQRKYTLQMQEAVAGANQVATERLGAVKTVRMLVAENKEEGAYGNKIQDIWMISRREGIAKGSMYGTFQFTGYMSMSAVLFYGSTLIQQGLLTYGDLSSFCLYAILCASSLSNMSGFFTEIMKGLGASSRLFELKDARPAIPLHGGVLKDGVQQHIRFEDVSFGYPDRDELFHGLSFTIPAGKVTAIVGPSGSGKSSIASLLLRLYDPSNGRIIIDDVDLKEIDPSHWRRQIGTVGQEPVLFSTTIRENIAYGAENPDEITDEQIHKAAMASNAMNFVNEFPKKFNTIVGEGGGMLSGGQKQRIAIARALLNNPKLMLLDEATSALDAGSELLVRTSLQKLIQEKNRTVLVIAHRLSTIRKADQIVVIEKGSVAECGTYDELMRIEDGFFKKLVEKQHIGLTDETF